VSRAPNRVFDFTSPTVITAALPDPFVREQRETREIIAARAPRPADRPRSFTGTARALEASRQASLAAQEQEFVRTMLT
jgi:hypothetical protein